MGLESIALGQLHWSTAKYAPLQERALWDGLAALHDEVGLHCSFMCSSSIGKPLSAPLTMLCWSPVHISCSYALPKRRT